MSETEGGAKQREREIAHNESVRQTTGDLRVSLWAIIVTVIVGLAVAGVIYAWLHH